MALGQLSFTSDGQIRDKVEAAIKRLQTFEPEEGYYVAFSGGKDSQCVYHLCQMAGVQFDAHYAVTSVDPPELVQFIKQHYPDAWEGRVHQYKDGKPITMWSLIAEHTLPPTRKVRYCCAALKEPGGQGRIVVTGVRWVESANRKKLHGVVTMPKPGKRIRTIATGYASNITQTTRGGVVMNDDNDESRRAVEHCYRTSKTMVNPIIDWTDEDVWEFLNGNHIPHCCLYDEGFKRLGCIGCPLSGSRNMERDFARWPKYRDMYVRAFQKMIDNHPGQIRILDPNAKTKFKLELAENSIGGYDKSVLQNGRGSAGLVPPRMEQDESLNGSSPTAIPDNSNSGGGYAGCNGGSDTAANRDLLGRAMLERWKKVALC